MGGAADPNSQVDLMDASLDHADPAPVSGARRLMPATMIAATVLSLSACGPRGSEEILRGGIPATTNLPRATTLPPVSVRTVSRRDFGWRVIYRPADAPPDADGRAAAALCGLESRAVARVEQAVLVSPFDDPGTRMIDIYCA